MAGGGSEDGEGKFRLRRLLLELIGNFPTSPFNRTVFKFLFLEFLRNQIIGTSGIVGTGTGIFGLFLISG